VAFALKEGLVLHMRKRVPSNRDPHSRNPRKKIDHDSVRNDGQKEIPGRIGVDLDGTLAKTVGGQTWEEIGPPIYPMVQLVKEWLARSEDIRIFTARVNPNHRGIDVIRARRAIEAWCQQHLGQVLPVTYEKDWDMVLLLDDRARQVEQDTGRVLGGRFT
jgi:hypothetical protein